MFNNLPAWVGGEKKRSENENRRERDICKKGSMMDANQISAKKKPIIGTRRFFPLKRKDMMLTFQDAYEFYETTIKLRVMYGRLTHEKWEHWMTSTMNSSVDYFASEVVLGLLQLTQTKDVRAHKRSKVIRMLVVGFLTFDHMGYVVLTLQKNVRAKLI